MNKVECPRCRAFQKFGEKRRQISEDEWEIYIQCSYCKWKDVVITGNLDNIRKTRKIKRLKGMKRTPKVEELINKYREQLHKK